MPTPLLRKIALAATAVGSTAFGLPNASTAYPIDCAILLCLSGGWPQSAECTAARAVFVRRITPWPVEPPLQIWRCPMGRASISQDASTRFAAAVSTIEGDASRIYGRPFAINFNEENGTADVDISGYDFDFVRSIRVYDIEWLEWNHENNKGENDCRRGRQRVRLGSYGLQGDFAWRDVSVTTATAQPWLGFTTRQDHNCNHAGSFRGIGVEWRDYEGNHGFEVVRY